VRTRFAAAAVVHSVLGLLLGAFAVLHGVQNYPAVKHSDAWTLHAAETALGFTFGVVVLCAIALHAILGLARWLRHRSDVKREGMTRDWGLTFQLVSGLCALGFIAYHVVQLWPSGAGSHASIREPYARMWNQLGTPIPLVVYVTGITAVAFHLGHGIARLLARTRSFIPGVVARAVGGVLGLVLLVLFVQIVARFALGEALIPALS
jgi:succinate dehydrogenase/fumarate reductase cytochrome b subunit